MTESRATLVAAGIGAIAALVAAYFAYQVGQRQLELQRAVLQTDIVVKTIHFSTPDFITVLNRLCAMSAVPRDDINALLKVGGVTATCPPKP
jgi:hypothetical protein